MFFEIPLDELDLDAQYFFNVLIAEITIPYDSDILSSEIMDEWDTTYISSPRPTVIHIYRDANLNAKVDFETAYIPHCVIAIDKDMRVSWWDMIDFFTIDQWEIMPELEDFDDEEQEED